MQDTLILEEPGEINLPDAELFYYPELLEAKKADELLALSLIHISEPTRPY